MDSIPCTQAVQLMPWWPLISQLSHGASGLTFAWLCRQQQAPQALLPLRGRAPQLRRPVPGQGVAGRHHGHAAAALLLQAG